jgi:hypothetical protein
MNDSEGTHEGAASQGRSWRFDGAWIGAGGIALYVVLRYPYAVFYSELGTTPEEVGLGYTQVLGQTSFAVLFILIFTVIGMFIIVELTHTSFGLMELRTNATLKAQPNVKRSHVAKLDDKAFETHMRTVEEYWSKSDADRKIFDSEAPLRRRLREIDRNAKNADARTFPFLKIPSAEERRVAHAIGSGVPFRQRLAKWQWPFVLILAFASTVFLQVATNVTIEVAAMVRECSEGVPLMGFNLGGEAVELFDITGQTEQLGDRDLILLGGDSNRYVLYDCRNQATLRIPTSGVLVIQPSVNEGHHLSATRE